MDEANMKDLKRRAPKGSKATLLLFGDFDPQGDRIIRDPYYVSNHLKVYNIISYFVNVIFEYLKALSD